MGNENQLGIAQVPVRATLDKLDGDLRSAKAKMDGGLGGIASSVMKTMGGIGAAVGKAALAVGVAGVAAIGVIAAASIKAGITVDDAMDTIIQKTGATGETLSSLEQSFSNVFGNFPGDAQTVADVIGDLNARMDITGKPLDDLSLGILRMSKYTKTDAATNVGLFTRVLGDWGIANEDAALTLDKVYKASQLTGVGVDSLMTKVVQFGAPLRLMGFSVDEAISMFAKWEKEGVNAELVMGSLRIAAGKFAKAEGEADTAVVGGVDSMEDANEQLATLQRQLGLAYQQQEEFTSKTKESTRVQKQMQIDKITKQITDLSAAMALGEKRTVTSAKETKTLGQNLRDTFKSIQENEDATAALALGMEVFGARAGPDMVAAIREGRFAIDDLVAAMGSAGGSIDATAQAVLDFPDRLEMMKNKVTLALAPLGLAFLDVASNVLDSALPALQTFSDFIKNTIAPAVGPALDGIREMFNAGSPESWAKLGVPKETIESLGQLADTFGRVKGIIATTVKGLLGGGNVWEDSAAMWDVDTGRWMPEQKGLKTQFVELGKNMLKWLGEGLFNVAGILDDLAADFVAWTEGDGGDAAYNLGWAIGDKIMGTLHDFVFGEDTSETVGKDLEDMLVAALTKINIGLDTLFAKTFSGLITNAVSDILGTDEFNAEIAKSLEDLFVKAFTLMSPLLVGQKIWKFIKDAISANMFATNPTTIATGPAGPPATYDPSKLLDPSHFAGGFSGIVRKPMTFQAGEIPEFLSVTPLSRLVSSGSSENSSLTINGGITVVSPNPSEAGRAVFSEVARRGRL